MNISVDLDSTLVHYDKWRGFDHIGEPIMPIVNLIKELLSIGNKVKIFTARADLDNPAMQGLTKEQVFAPIEAWCEKHLGQKLEITCKKSFDTDIFIDDRAIQVVPNQGIILQDILEESIKKYTELVKNNENLLLSYKNLEREHKSLFEGYQEIKHRMDSLEK